MFNEKENWCYHCMTEQKEENDECSVCGITKSEENPEGTLPLGTLLNNERFVVGEFLEQNGQINTYIARDTENNKPVFLKEFYPETGISREDDLKTIKTDKDSAMRFKTYKSDFIDLYQTLQDMEGNTHVEKVYCLFDEFGTSYAVTKKVTGMTLRDFYERFSATMKWTVPLQLIRDMLEAVQSLHENGIIHGMINPDTVTFDRKGNIVYKDFVLLKEKETDTTQSGFLAPEQYRNDTFQGVYSDIYAVAACFYYLLTGESPQIQIAEDDTEVYKILADITKINDEVPQYVKEAIEHALQVKIADRTNSAELMLEELGDEHTGANYQIAAQVFDEEYEYDEVIFERNADGKRTLGVKSRIILAVSVAVTVILLTVFVYTGLRAPIGTEPTAPAVTEDDGKKDNPNYELVPDFYGKNVEEIDKIIKDKGLSFNIQYRYTSSSEVGPGRALRQDPEANTYAVKGARIRITLVSAS